MCCWGLRLVIENDNRNHNDNSNNKYFKGKVVGVAYSWLLDVSARADRQSTHREQVMTYCKEDVCLVLVLKCLVYSQSNRLNSHLHMTWIVLNLYLYFYMTVFASLREHIDMTHHGCSGIATKCTA